MKDQVFNGITLSKECTFCKYHPSNAAQTGGTQPTDVQQLKPKMPSYADAFCAIGVPVTCDERKGGVKMYEYIARHFGR
jgi:hypothetical protein